MMLAYVQRETDHDAGSSSSVIAATDDASWTAALAWWALRRVKADMVAATWEQDDANRMLTVNYSVAANNITLTVPA